MKHALADLAAARAASDTLREDLQVCPCRPLRSGCSPCAPIVSSAI